MQKQDIQQLADLARLEISDNGPEELRKDLEGVLRYVEQINEVTTEGVEPEAGTHRNVMREDGEPHESGAYTEELMKETPEEREGYVKVKKILN